MRKINCKKCCLEQFEWFKSFEAGEACLECGKVIFSGRMINHSVFCSDKCCEITHRDFIGLLEGRAGDLLKHAASCKKECCNIKRSLKNNEHEI